MKSLDVVEFKDKKSDGKYPHDGTYIILNMSARMKDPSTGQWFDAVIYSKWMYGTPYIREKQDFLNKFKLVKNEKE